MDPFLGEIRLFGFPFAPTGWAFCQGQSLSITRYTALYSLLGTNYGGDGRQNFNLPNLQAFVLCGANPDPIGTTKGSSTVTIDQTTMAAHFHNLIATTQTGASATAAADVFAATQTTSKSGTQLLLRRYSTAGASTALSPSSIGPTGQGQAHNNLQPYLVLNYCIALQGIYPPRP